MEHFEKLTGRRKFLEKGIMGGVMIATFPLCNPFHSTATQSKSISPSHDYSQDESHRKLLKIVKTYGGEFGDTRGGL
jgi:hypothetical protein